MCETASPEKLNERDELLGKLETKIGKLNKIIAEQTTSNRKLCNNLDYYKNKFKDDL